MNWKRGLWRAWGAISAGWIVLWFVAWALALPLSAFWGVILYAIFPPLVLLTLGLIVAWVIRGFQREAG